MGNIPNKEDDDNSNKEFNWDDLEDCIVQQPRPKVAVYTNRNDDVVIRKQEEYGIDDGDTWIIISRDNVENVARALLYFSEHPEDGRVHVAARRAEPVSESVEGRRALSAAERQKRYREKKKRNASRESVTPPLLFAAE